MIDRALTWNETFFSHLNKQTVQNSVLLKNDVIPSINLGTIITDNKPFSNLTDVVIDLNEDHDSDNKFLKSLAIIAVFGIIIFYALKINENKQKNKVEDKNTNS